MGPAKPTRAGARGRRILYGDSARAALGRGIDRMAALVAPTLGPAARCVAIDSLTSSTPEVLDSGGTIARRTIQLPDPFEDMGAMLLRDLLRDVLERNGDGTATTAVLTRALIGALQRLTLHGASLPALEHGLTCALQATQQALRGQARPITGAAAIASVASAVVPDAAVARLIGEVFEATGPDGAVVVESGEAVETTSEYIEGARWDSGLVSADAFLAPGEAALRLLEPCLLLCDSPLADPLALAPVLEACLAAGRPRLFVVAPEVRESVVALLVTNRQRGVLESAAAVSAPSTGDQRTAILHDLAVISGGRVVQAAGGGLASFSAADLGHARQAWATRGAFGILGGRGGRGAIRQRVAEARADLHRAGDDQHLRRMTQQRIGRLLGLGAVVRVGAASDLEREALRLRTESAVAAARLALAEGVVAGGGTALVACARSVRCLPLTGDEALAAAALAEALEAPMWTILRNAGYQEPGRLLEEARTRGAATTFDVLRSEWVDAFEVGLLDPLVVPRTAVEVAVSAAGTAMKTDALVRRRQVAPPPGR